jgi:hypothetical protein
MTLFLPLILEADFELLDRLAFHGHFGDVALALQDFATLSLIRECGNSTAGSSARPRCGCGSTCQKSDRS